MRVLIDNGLEELKKLVDCYQVDVIKTEIRYTLLLDPGWEKVGFDHVSNGNAYSRKRSVRVWAFDLTDMGQIVKICEGISGDGIRIDQDDDGHLTLRIIYVES